jgi:SagB-type dehydrogenase family enzyme
MARDRGPVVVFGFVALLLFLNGSVIPAAAQAAGADQLIRLPAPSLDGSTSVEQALAQRRSVRQFSDAAPSLEQIGQLLWAAQGITEPAEQPRPGWRAEWQWMGGLRTAPSAGALYPLELYVVAADVEGLDAGLYHYIPQEHALMRSRSGDLREPLANAALRQTSITDAPAVFVIAGVFQRTAVKYGERAERYVHIEVGAVAENIYLQAQALDLGAVLMGAFRDDAVHECLGLPDDHEPLAIMPVGAADRR